MAILNYSGGLNAAGQQTSAQRSLGAAGQMQGLQANQQEMQRQQRKDEIAQQQQKVALDNQAQKVYARGDINEIA